MKALWDECPLRRMPRGMNAHGMNTPYDECPSEETPGDESSPNPFIDLTTDKSLVACLTAGTSLGSIAGGICPPDFKESEEYFL